MASPPTSLPPAPAPGTARAALGHRNFRILFFGSFASNIGTWMQHVTLGAYALGLTGSPTFLGLILFAQLGPMLVLSVLGGALADLLDRRRLLLAAQTEQMLATAALAYLVARGDPSEASLLVVVALIGIGSALHHPTYSAVLPALVGRADLAGAVALNSTQMNTARVVGPALGGVAFSAFGAAAVFGLNAVTYLFAIAALVLVRIPKVEAGPAAGVGWRRLAGGFAVARDDAVVRRSLLTMAAFALLCLPFIGQMPTVAERNLGIDPSSAAYGLLYTCFGVGAIIGAASVGTVMAGRAKEPIVRLGLLGFAGSLAVFAALRSAGPAYVVVTVLGMAYFTTVTALSIVLQQRLADAVRGRVMALWSMAFGGVIPLGHLLAGPVVERSSITFVMGYGAVTAVALAAYADLAGAGSGAPRLRLREGRRRPGAPPAVPVPPPDCP
ncbi:MAG TPA: MFS transporter [Acidimicrobiales bacterium]|nr:MFS transporter [Acidimicrobiales bacterium]